MGTEFRSEKIPQNRLGTVSVIPRKKALIPRHSEFRRRANSEVRNGTEWNSAEKISYTKQQQNNLTKRFVCTSKVVFSGTIIRVEYIYFNIRRRTFLFSFFSYPYFTVCSIHWYKHKLFFVYVIITDIEDFSRVKNFRKRAKRPRTHSKTLGSRY